MMFDRSGWVRGGMLGFAFLAAAASAPAASAQDAKPEKAIPKQDKPAEKKPDDKKAGDKKDAKPGDQKAGDAKADIPKGDMAALEIKLPRPAFKGTPKDVPPGTNLEKPRSGPRPPFLAPKGTTNVALGKLATSSDKDPVIGSLKVITDGDKEANEGSYVELGPGLQWVQLDLGKVYSLYASVLWHNHSNARIYHDVVVQTADDADFIKNVKTLYSNDHDNSSGLGVGEEKEYWETFEGRLMDLKGTKARFIRFYSKGSTADDLNQYVEIEVYGKE